MQVGMNIRKYRKSKKLTITQLATMAGTQREYLSAIENGKKTPSFTMLEKLSSSLGVQMNDLTESESTLSPELKKLVDNAKQLPDDVLDGLNTMVESMNNHYKTVEKVINGIETRYTIDLNVKPEGLTEEEELEAQQLFQRLAEIRREKRT